MTNTILGLDERGKPCVAGSCKKLRISMCPCANVSFDVQIILSSPVANVCTKDCSRSHNQKLYLFLTYYIINMVVPIIIFYALGFIFLIFLIEGDTKDKRQEIANIIYPGLGVFINLIGYYISYTVADYVTLAYFPLAMMVISLMFLLYRVYQTIPSDTPWGSDDGESERFKKRNPLE